MKMKERNRLQKKYNYTVLKIVKQMHITNICSYYMIWYYLVWCFRLHSSTRALPLRVRLRFNAVCKPWNVMEQSHYKIPWFSANRAILIHVYCVPVFSADFYFTISDNDYSHFCSATLFGHVAIEFHGNIAIRIVHLPHEMRKRNMNAVCKKV